MNYVIKDVQDILFANASEIMEELSAKTGEFTFKKFLQTITRKNQEAYIEMLQRCTAHPSATPFNACHQHIGNHLSYVAQQAGYERIEAGMIDDIFGNPTKNIIYRRSQN